MPVSHHSPIVFLNHSPPFHNFIPPPPRSPPSFSRHTTETSVLTRSSNYSMEVAGVDSDGKAFTSAQEMWREEIGDEGDETMKTQWYRDGVSYWEGVEASVNGVLGGYGHVNDADITGSEAFLQPLLHERLVDGGTNRHLVALDCGSGIGRITKNLLIRYFNEVDLLEPVAHFLDAARENLASTASETHKAANFFCVPLQVTFLKAFLYAWACMISWMQASRNATFMKEFIPAPGRYDVIWVQWCIGHLTDDDFVSFFNRAKASLKPSGFLVLKENVSRSGFVLDKEDRSITRSDFYFKELFRRCGLHLYKTKDQKGLPEELFAVKMYALTVDMPKKVYKTKLRARGNRPQIIK